MNLYVFNPENDLALANNLWHFIAPASARKMRADLETLPAWWASAGDGVWVERQPADFPARNLGHQVQWEVSPLVSSYEEVCPWGWSPLIVAQLERAGVSREKLPDANAVQLIRRLSGRALAVEVLRELREKEGLALGIPESLLCGRSYYCTDSVAIQSVLSRYPRTLLKAPWSGSGKGLRLGLPQLKPPLSGWCERLLRDQGGVVVEPLYNKVYDLALEFTSDGVGHVQYEGISLFMTTPQGAYAGNRMMPDAGKRAFLSQWIPPEVLDRVQVALCRLLGPRLAGYRGPLGVDMMICRDEEGDIPVFRLHPCVEVNLRMTMGMVALRLERWLAPGVCARFVVDFQKESASLQRAVMQRRQENPPRFSEERLCGGILELTPVYSDTQYHARIEVEQDII